MLSYKRTAKAPILFAFRRANSVVLPELAVTEELETLLIRLGLIETDTINTDLMNTAITGMTGFYVFFAHVMVTYHSLVHT